MFNSVVELEKLWTRICLNFGASKEETEDIIQDMYLKLLTEVDIKKIKYGDNGVNRYYIYKMLKSSFIDLKRNKLLNNSYQLNEELNIAESDDYEAAKDQALEDIMKDIKLELSTRRRSLQRLFELYYRIPLNSDSVYQGENLSYRDIARESGISLSTVFNDMKELKGIIGLKREDIQDYFNGDYDRIQRN
tara:strand:- start:124 stop:696 length:573 start_codon:yes stop_codon:yes gene_type:complete